MPDTLVRQGRNAPCRCGSGKKAKRCCGAEPAPLIAEDKKHWDDESYGEWQRKLDRRACSAVIHSRQYITRTLTDRRQLHHRELWPATRHRAFEVLFALVYDNKPVPKEPRSKAQAMVSRARNDVYTDRAPGQNRREYKRQSWFRPDKDEEHVRELARRWREERQARISDGHGDISGLMAVASELAAMYLQQQHGELDGDEHFYALSRWLYGVWGELTRRFVPDEQPAEFMGGVPGYWEWRAQ